MSVTLDPLCRCADCVGEDDARAVEARLEPTPQEIADLVAMADRAIARHDEHELYWRDVRRAAICGAEPAPIPLDEDRV